MLNGAFMDVVVAIGEFMTEGVIIVAVATGVKTAEGVVLTFTVWTGDEGKIEGISDCVGTTLVKASGSWIGTDLVAEPEDFLGCFISSGTLAGLGDTGWFLTERGADLTTSLAAGLGDIGLFLTERGADLTTLEAGSETADLELPPDAVALGTKTASSPTDADALPLPTDTLTCLLNI